MAAGPLVSVVIPVFNGSAYLREAIESALAQTYPNVEILVVDDGSNDGGATAAIVRSYGGLIRPLRQENGGVASALNLGIRAMRGEFFSWLSHDDAYLPHKLSSQIAALPRLGGDTVLYADYEIIDGTGKRIGCSRNGGIPEAMFRRALVTETPVNGCTVLVPGRCFERAGLFDESLKTTQDYDLWFRMADCCRFVHQPLVVLKSRVHPAQGTRALAAACRAEGNALHIRFLETLANERQRAPAFDRFLLYAAVRLRQLGYTAAAARALSMYLEESHAGRGFPGTAHRAAAGLFYGLLDRRPFRGVLAKALRSWAFSGSRRAFPMR